MSKLGSLMAAVVFGMIVAIVSCANAATERRLALVVGNSDYKTPGMSLLNPRNDAGDMSQVLRELDFEVITALDATKDAMEAKLEEFARKAATADTVLFFYAGHAMQYEGQNYLVPTDAELVDKYSLRHRMVALADVQAELEGASGVKIMILDACRNNPLAAQFMARAYPLSRSASLTRGLARVDKTEGMVIAYATAPDETAQDGTGRNSPFTSALLKQLRQPGLSIVSMFQRVTGDVQKETLGKQRPQVLSQLSSEFVLNNSDRFVWDTLDKDDPDAMQHFFQKFPSSPLAPRAQDRFELLMRSKTERDALARQAAEAQRIAQEAARRAEEERNRAERLAQETARRQAEEERRKAEAQKQADQDAERERIALDTRRRAEEQAAKDASQRTREEQQRTAENERNRAETDRQRTAIEEFTRHAEELRKQTEADRKRVEEAAQQVEEQRKQAEADRRRVDESAQRVEEERKKVAAELERITQEAAQRREEERRQAESDRQRAAEADARRLDEAKAQLYASYNTSTQAMPQEPKQPAIELPIAPTAPEVNTTRQIRKAQQALRLLACFNGPPDGNLDSKTRQAVKEYWAKTGHKGEVEVKITDEFIAELEEQEEEICKPERPRKPPGTTVQAPPRPSRPHSIAARPRDEEPARATSSPRPAARPAEEQRATRTTSSSGGGGGGGGGSPIILGIGH